MDIIHSSGQCWTTRHNQTAVIQFFLDAADVKKKKQQQNSIWIEWLTVINLSVRNGRTSKKAHCPPNNTPRKLGVDQLNKKIQNQKAPNLSTLTMQSAEEGGFLLNQSRKQKTCRNCWKPCKSCVKPPPKLTAKPKSMRHLWKKDEKKDSLRISQTKILCKI